MGAFEFYHRRTGEPVVTGHGETRSDAIANLLKAGKGRSVHRAAISKADLQPFRDDVFRIIRRAIPEIPGLRKALIDGRINGSAYTGDCACLVGTIANIRFGEIANTDQLAHEALADIHPDVFRLAELFFGAIDRGDTPATNQFSALAVQWIDEFLAELSAVADVFAVSELATIEPLTAYVEA